MTQITQARRSNRAKWSYTGAGDEEVHGTLCLFKEEGWIKYVEVWEKIRTPRLTGPRQWSKQLFIQIFMLAFILYTSIQYLPSARNL